MLVELGIHNPLAAEIGENGESEMVLAKRSSRSAAGELAFARRSTLTASGSS